MQRRILALTGAAALAAGLALAAPASAGNVAWSVSIGGPGYGVAAVAPYGYAPYRAYGPAPVYVAPAPVYYPAPVYVAPPVVYAPYGVAYGVRRYPAYYAPRVVYRGHHRHW